MNRYSLVIFDLDGTLIDSSEGIIHAVLDTIKLLNYEPLSAELIKSCIGPPIGDSIGSRVGYTPEEIESFYKVFRPIYKNNYLMECTVYPGITSLLGDLKNSGVTLAISTNKREDYTKILLENLGLTKYFDYIEAMDMSGKMKKTDLIKNCIVKSGCSPINTVMVGDAYNDYNAAKTCEVNFVGVRYGFGFKKSDNLDFVTVNNVEDLISKLL